MRAWPAKGFGGVLIDVVDALRICLDVTIGGRDLSFFTWSSSGFVTGMVLFMEDDLCNPPFVDLTGTARGGGGPIDPLLLATLPAALGGLLAIEVDVLRVNLVAEEVAGFTGNRLGDWLVPLLSEPLDRSAFVPDIDGLRNECVRAGGADMVYCLMRAI